MYLTQKTRASRPTSTGSSEYPVISIITRALTAFHRPNVPLSCTTRSIEIPGGHTPYIPPHPQRGTPYHRYVLLLLPQPSPTEPISVPALSDADRLRFNVREFTAHHGLDGSTGGGAHMWRQVWDEGVSHIYATVLGMSPALLRTQPSYTTSPCRTRRTQIRSPTQARPLCGYPWNQAIHQIDTQCSNLSDTGRIHFLLIRLINLVELLRISECQGPARWRAEG